METRKRKKDPLDGLRFYEVTYVNPLGIEQIAICAGGVTESYRAILDHEGSKIVGIRELL